MKHVGLFGGTFDPPHMGHLLIAKYLLHETTLNEIWLIPTYIPPHKEVAATASKHRLKMLQLMIENEAEQIYVCPIEIDRGGTSYTIDTVTILQESYPSYTFSFIIGGDQVNYLHEWKNIDKLKQMIQFIGIERPNVSWQHVPFVKKVNVPLINISSTKVREMIQANRPFEHYVPEKVYQYIKEHQLYGYRKHP